MAKNHQEKITYRLAGYAALVDRYHLDVIPNWHKSLVTTSGIHRINLRAGGIEEVYPPKYWPGDTLGDHLEFARDQIVFRDRTYQALLDPYRALCNAAPDGGTR